MLRRTFFSGIAFARPPGTWRLLLFMKGKGLDPSSAEGQQNLRVHVLTYTHADITIPLSEP